LTTNSFYELNLGCFHPVARVRSNYLGFNPSTQRHYRRLIYYIYIYIYIATCQLSSPKVVIYFQPDDGRTTETCSYVYISNILTYDSDVA
jgi:hypothetical protein